jgi:integrase/recombinase XerD
VFYSVFSEFLRFRLKRLILTKFSIWCTKLFSELATSDIDDYIDSFEFEKSTKRLHTVIIRSLLKEANPAIYHKILLEHVESTVTPSDLLTMEEIEKVIDTAYMPDDKAIIACLYDSGARIGELMSCKIRDLNFDNYGCTLYLRESKTIKRTVRLIYAASYMRVWNEAHPRKNEPDAPIWCTRYKPYDAVSPSAMYRRIAKIRQQSGVEKRINPHKFRYTRATELAKKFNDSEQKLYAIFGWQPTSKTAGVYVKFTDKDRDDMILDAEGIKWEEEPETPKTRKCPRCGEFNPASVKKCKRCGLEEDEVEILPKHDFNEIK